MLLLAPFGRSAAKRIRSNSFNIHKQIVNIRSKSFAPFLTWMKDFLESLLELLQHLFEWILQCISICNWVVFLCIQRIGNIQILFLMQLSCKVRINPQQIFSEKSKKSINNWLSILRTLWLSTFIDELNQSIDNYWHLFSTRSTNIDQLFHDQFLYLTSRFHIVMHLFSNRSQMTLKSGKKKRSGTWATDECVTDVYHSSMESICFIQWREKKKRFTHTCLVMLGCLRACVSLGIFKSQTLLFVSVLLYFFTQFLEKVF